jgi:hypothetical protein
MPAARVTSSPCDLGIWRGRDDCYDDVFVFVTLALGVLQTTILTTESAILGLGPGGVLSVSVWRVETCRTIQVWPVLDTSGSGLDE